MLFRSHIVFSLLVYLMFFKLSSLNFSSKIIFGIFLFLATILVDIDSRKSKIGKFWFFRPLQWFFSHRGMIHSIFFALFSSFLIYLIDSNAGIGFLAGYLSHLLLDFFTKEGILVVWPFYNYKVSLIGIKTGGIIEEIFFVLVFLFDIYLIIITFV